MPCNKEDHALEYSEVFDMWFPRSAQPKGFKREMARKSFLQGGYYRHDFEGQEFSLISLNSIQFMKKNIC